MAEVEKAMKCLALDKSPESDGLTSNVYRHFWEHLKDIFFHLFKEISKSNILPTTGNNHTVMNSSGRCEAGEV